MEKELSQVDDVTEGVQPDDGQGVGGSDAPYAEYLDRIPEDARGVAEEAFKAWDANYTRHQQEAAEYRKGWEAYEQAGVNQYSPQDIQAAFQLLQDPNQARAWLDQQYGPVAQPEPDVPEVDDSSFYDPGQQQMEQLLQKQLGPIQQRLEAFAQWQEQQEYAAREQAAMQMIQGQIDELKAKHGDEFNEEYVEKLVGQYIESDPQNAVPRAWADYQAIVNQISKATLQSKADAPRTAEGGGLPDTMPEDVKTLKDAGRIAMERLRQARLA